MDGDPSAGGPRSRGTAARGEGGPVAEVDPAPRKRVPCRGPPRGAGEVSNDGERVLAAGLGKRGAGLRRRRGGPSSTSMGRDARQAVGERVRRWQRGQVQGGVWGRHGGGDEGGGRVTAAARGKKGDDGELGRERGRRGLVLGHRRRQ
jgi:hypothetical protein